MQLWALLMFFTTSSPAYVEVFDVFSRTYVDSGLPPERLRVGFNHRLGFNERHGFQSDSWHAALRHKIHFYRAGLASLQPEEVGVFVDADVQFFPPATSALADIIRHMGEANLDIMFMREGGGQDVNSGLILAKNTNRTSALLADVAGMIAESTLELGDQTAFNRLLLNKPGWGHIDTKYTIFGMDLPQPADVPLVAFHHAIGCVTTSDKLRQLDVVRTYVCAHDAQAC